MPARSNDRGLDAADEGAPLNASFETSPAPREWWKDFFNGLAVEFWREAVPPEVTLGEVEFLWKHLRLTAGARVLDVPCGAGRLAIPLARRGARVTGVDVSAEFLDAAREEASRANADAAWIHADMRELPRGDSNRFDAAFCFGNSFGYLDDSGN